MPGGGEWCFLRARRGKRSQVDGPIAAGLGDPARAASPFASLAAGIVPGAAALPASLNPAPQRPAGDRQEPRRPLGDHPRAALNVRRSRGAAPHHEASRNRDVVASFEIRPNRINTLRAELSNLGVHRARQLSQPLPEPHVGSSRLCGVCPWRRWRGPGFGGIVPGQSAPVAVSCRFRRRLEACETAL